MKAFSNAALSILTVCMTILITTGTTRGDLVQYTMSGVLPDGSTIHPFISDGESFVATFIVDRSILDSDDDPQIGYYLNSVVFGTLEFSGGYVAPANYAGNRTVVLNDWQGADTVSIRGNGLIVQANNEDLATFDSDVLPAPGFGFVSAPDPGSIDYFQLSYGDDLGSVFYVSSQANNVRFQASGIPEPASALVLGVWLLGLQRRRRG